MKRREAFFECRRNSARLPLSGSDRRVMGSSLALRGPQRETLRGKAPTVFGRVDACLLLACTRVPRALFQWGSFLVNSDGSGRHWQAPSLLIAAVGGHDTGYRLCGLNTKLLDLRPRTP